MTFNSFEFKKQFPIFQYPENRDLCYFDNAATTQKPHGVIEAIQTFYARHYANTHRSSHRLGRYATELVEDTRKSVAHMLGAQDTDIVFCGGTTDGLNLLADSLVAQVNEGDHIVLSLLEHHANLIPWQRLAKKTGAELRFIPEKNGAIDIEAASTILSPKTKIVSVSSASNVTGAITDLNAIHTLIDREKCIFIVDAAQTAGHFSINVSDIDCDFLVFSPHKCYGPTGIGILFGKQKSFDKLPAWKLGGGIVEEVSQTHNRLIDSSTRFEPGTQSLGAIAGLRASTHFINQLDINATQKHKKQCLNLIHDHVSHISEFKLFSPQNQNCGIITFASNDTAKISMMDLGRFLDAENIAVRVGHHCAQPLHQIFGNKETLRVSLAPYNTLEDAEKFIKTLRSFMQTENLQKNTSKDITKTKNTASILFSENELHHKIKHAKSAQEKNRILMMWSRNLDAIPNIKTPKYEIKGCETKIWMRIAIDNNKVVHYSIEAESKIMKGLAYLVTSLLQNQTEDSIRKQDINTLLKPFNLQQWLTPSRSNGLYTLTKKALSLDSMEQK